MFRGLKMDIQIMPLTLKQRLNRLYTLYRQYPFEVLDMAKFTGIVLIGVEILITLIF